MLGSNFERLTIIGEGGKLPNGKQANGTQKFCSAWLCSCECGNTTKVLKLKWGKRKSCGCINKELASKRAPFIAIKHGQWNKKHYSRWRSMIARCYDENHDSYFNYGGRGIKVCDEWRLTPINFIKWCEETCPNRFDYSVDRINNDGNYEPSNCKWATAKEQNMNQRPRKKVAA